MAQQFRRDYFWRDMNQQNRYELRVAMAILGWTRLPKLPIDAPVPVYDEDYETLVCECPYRGDSIILVGLFGGEDGESTEYHLAPAKWISPEDGYKVIKCDSTLPGKRIKEWRFAYQCWKGNKGVMVREPNFFGNDSDD